MPNISASVPDNLKSWIETQIEIGNYASASDYVRDLIRMDQRKKQNLDQLLLDGLHSGEAIQANVAYWKKKKEALTDRT